MRTILLLATLHRAAAKDAVAVLLTTKPSGKADRWRRSRAAGRRIELETIQRGGDAVDRGHGRRFSALDGRA